MKINVRNLLLYLYPLRYMVVRDTLTIIKHFNIRTVADYGIGNALYKSKLINSGVESYIGVDIYNGKNVDYLVDEIKNIGSEFDLVICLDVLQHCDNPIETLKIISTLLADGGLLYVTWPLLYPICDLKDYWRWTPDGFQKLCHEANFSILQQKQRGSICLSVISLIIFCLQKMINGDFASWNKRTERYGKVKILISFILTLPFYPIAWICYIVDLIFPNICITVGYRCLLKHDSSILR